MDEIGSNLIKDININVLGHGRVINSFVYDRAIHFLAIGVFFIWRQLALWETCTLGNLGNIDFEQFGQLGHWTHWVTWTLGNLATVIIGKLMFWKTWHTLLRLKKFQACYTINFWGIKSSCTRQEMDPSLVTKKDKMHYHRITILLTYYGP